MVSNKEIEEKIKFYQEQADIAYSNGLDTVGDIYSQKAREMKDQLNTVQEEVKDDAPFRLKLFGSACFELIKQQKEDLNIQTDRFTCSGCERHCDVVIRPGYIGLNEDGMTVYFPQNIAKRGDMND